MQISRHWRMNANRYRLEGFALADGTKALQYRHSRSPECTPTRSSVEEKKREAVDISPVTDQAILAGLAAVEGTHAA